MRSIKEWFEVKFSRMKRKLKFGEGIERWD